MTTRPRDVDGHINEFPFIEDDGIVLAIVLDVRRQRTRLVGLDGRDPAGKPLFTASLDRAVPLQLHGLFTRRQVGAA